ncbi:MAG: adenosine deaminase, partial [Lachnospiraceae bacterium]|nr:adenosine deaminase [Lachnospiraceae bacterium]
GGSFNNDSHHTKLRPENCAFLKDLLEKADPEKVFFVIGHRLSGYEKYLLQENKGRFEIFAFVPSVVTAKEREKLLNAGISVRISIEQSGLGLYKSVSYEIFKRRPSVLLALDGNSAGANMIQEAKNGRGGCRIFISGYSRTLRAKAASLTGYVTVFTEPRGIAEMILNFPAD